MKTDRTRPRAVPLLVARLPMDCVSRALRRKAEARQLMQRTGERSFHKAVARVRRREARN